LLCSAAVMVGRVPVREVFGELNIPFSSTGYSELFVAFFSIISDRS